MNDMAQQTEELVQNHSAKIRVACSWLTGQRNSETEIVASAKACEQFFVHGIAWLLVSPRPCPKRCSP
jgi:hypothetical protein